MKFIRNLFILTVAVFGLYSISVCAQTKALGKNLTEGLEKQVRKEILTQPYYGVFDAISFKVEGSVVYLSGSVVEPITKSGAERSIVRLRGVTDVVNRIEVLPLSNFDNEIRQAVVQAFDRNGGTIYRYIQGINPSLRIIVKNGHVSLEGYVSSQSDADLANILANGVFGVFGVSNNLTVDRDRVN